MASGERPARPRPTWTDRPARESVEEVYVRLRAPMLRLAHLLTGSVDLAEDVVHDAFVSCSRHWSRLDIADAYVRRAVINHAYATLRRAGRERDKTARYSRATSVTVAPPELDETWGVLRQLPDRQRMAVVLRFYEDLPEAEIAELLGCRPGTVKSLVHRALAKLRKETRR
jgi:RNA polymerase sigma-70 factor (sigma-E family)